MKQSKPPLTPRGYHLAYSDYYLDDHCPVVCVELCNKWYQFFVVYPERVRANRPAAVVGYPFPLDCPDGEAPFLDHAPNPKAIAAWAQAHGCLIDELSWELIIGRWECEYHNRYHSEQVAV